METATVAGTPLGLGPFYRTSSSVRLWWEFEEPKGPKGTDTITHVSALQDARGRQLGAGTNATPSLGTSARSCRALQLGGTT